jgi:hypothetical protein
MAQKQTDGRVLIAELTAAQDIYFALGTGNPDWDTMPEAEPVSATTLVAEVGRRKATTISYVLPDIDGAIETPQGNYAISATPTRFLYLTCTFAFTELADEHIREVGVFANCITKAGLPAGQRFFLPDEVTAPGRCLLIDRSQNFVRSGTVRPSFEYVLPY